MSALFVTDLDGTLLRADRRFNPADLRALAGLPALGLRSAIATGRSVHTFRQALARAEQTQLPIDYLVFSNGAGVLDWRNNRLIEQHALDGPTITEVTDVLLRAGRNFCVHLPVPENHRFLYHQGDRHPDFLHRVQLHQPHCVPLEHAPLPAAASQLLVVCEQQQYDALSAQLLDAIGRDRIRIIRTSSPFDDSACWVEVYPVWVDKGQTCRRLARALGLQRLASIGNDFNDLELLAESDRGFVVANAVAPLRQRFELVASNDEAGVAEAIARLCAELEGR